MEELINQPLALLFGHAVPFQAPLDAQGAPPPAPIIHQSFKLIKAWDKRPQDRLFGLGRKLLHPLDHLGLGHLKCDHSHFYILSDCLVFQLLAIRHEDIILY